MTQFEERGTIGDWLRRLPAGVLASLKRDWPLHLFFLSLVAMRFYAVAEHELWRDDVHYYLRARDAGSVWELVQGLRYERHLVLWPLMMYGLQSIGLTSIAAIQALHLSISVLLLAIVIYGLRPISLTIRILIGASYLLMYEYTAIIHSYSLIALLLGVFLLLELRGRRHTIWKALTLLLMALTNIFGVILALALTAYLLLDMPRQDVRGRIWLGAIMGAGMLFGLYMLWAPSNMYEPNLIAYRESVFASAGIPRAATTINRLTFDGFFYFPQMTSEHWWDGFSLARYWLLGDSRVFYSAAIVAATAGLWFMLRLFRSRAALGVAVCILWFGIMGLIATQHPGGFRHLGIAVMGTLVLVALAKYKHKKLAIGRAGTALILLVLVMQAVSGIWAVVADGRQTFSQGPAVAEWLEANQPGQRLIVYPDYAGIPIAAYTGGHFYSLESSKEISYVQMDTERSEHVSPFLVDSIDLDEEPRLLITNFPFEYRVIAGRIEVELLQSFGPAIEVTEGNYHIYRLSSREDLQWDAQFIPYHPPGLTSVSWVEATTDHFATFRTTENESGMLVYDEDMFDNATGSTAEIRLKLLGGPQAEHDAGFFSLQDGSREGKISFFDDRIELRDGNTLGATHPMDTTGQFHSYRLAIVGSSLEAFVDGDRVASMLLHTDVANKAVIFGDGSFTMGENLSAQVEHIAYSVRGAFAPTGQRLKEPSAPSAPVVEVLPDSPQHSEGLVCAITTESTDADGDTVEYSYAWYRDGVLQPHLTTNTVDSPNTSGNETWTCVVTPNDGFFDGPSGEDGVTVDSGIWDEFSGMHALPESETGSLWQMTGAFESVSVSDGVLAIGTGGADAGYFNRTQEAFDNSVGSTLEIRMKLVEGPQDDHDASLLHLHDGARGGKVCFFDDRIEVYDGNTLLTTHEMDTTDAFHTYRLTILRDTFEVFVDGRKTTSATISSPASDKGIMFGDGSVAPDENFNVQVDYIAHSVRGAVAP